MKRNIVLGITGASGATYAVRLLEVLLAAGCDVHLSISEGGRAVLKEELDLEVDLDEFEPEMVMPLGGPDPNDEKLQMVRTLAGISTESSNVLSVPSGEPGKVRYWNFRNWSAAVASGSFLTDGMVVCPCSGGTLSAIVRATNANLIHRAAEVHLKEHRKLILVPRETPLSLVQLENMRRAAEIGAVVLPAMPAFYHGVTTIQDLVDFVVARICDQLGIDHALVRRWGS